MSELDRIVVLIEAQFDNTILEDGVIIDNLVQIAHNVHIGSNTAIAAKCGIAGSTKLAKLYSSWGVWVAGHLSIADNVTLTGMSMVTKIFLKLELTLREPDYLKIIIGKTIVRLRQLADVPLTQITKRLDHIQAQIESLESTFNLRK